MSDTENPQNRRPHRATSQGFRDQRRDALNAALRENLRRRKAADVTETPAPEADHENARENDGDGQ